MPTTTGEKLIAEAEMMRDADGILRVSVIHDYAAANKEISEFARRLEWDDPVAGKLYRYQQIRHLIAIYMISEVDDKRGRSEISIKLDRINPGGGYRRLSDIVDNNRLMESALKECLDKIRQLEDRYAWIEATREIWQAAAAARSAAEARQARRERRQQSRRPPDRPTA